MSTHVTNEEFEALLENSEGKYIALDGAQPVVLGKVAFADDGLWVSTGGRYVDAIRVETAKVAAIWKGKYKPLRFNPANENWIMRKTSEGAEVTKAPKKTEKKAKHQRVTRDNWDDDAVIEFLTNASLIHATKETQAEALRLLEEANNVIHRLESELQAAMYQADNVVTTCKHALASIGANRKYKKSK